LQGLNQHIATVISSQFWLERIYPEEIKQAYQSGRFHIHDLGFLSVYCVGWDLEDLLVSGFTGVAGKIESRPAKHLRTILGQIVNFFYTMQGEAAGAQLFQISILTWPHLYAMIV
jgi:ribonucleoside-triphosphate reductase